MTARTRAAIVTSLTLGVIGCTESVRDPAPVHVDGPSDAGPPGPDGTTSLDLSIEGSNQLALALAVLCDGPAYGACTAPWACGCDVHGLVAGEPPEDLDRCVAVRRSMCDDRMRDGVRDGLAHGWRVDAHRATRCVAARRRLYDACLAPVDDVSPPDCRDAIVTSDAMGEPCEAEGLRCAGGAGTCVEGSCAGMPGPGETCRMGCAAGSVCVDGTCRAPVEAGGACRDHGDCASPEPCVAGRCGAPVKVGDPCTDQAECEALATCVAGRCARVPPECTTDEACGAAGACVRFPVHTCLPRSAPGERCEDDAACPVGMACARETLGAPGHCDRLPRWDEPCSGPCEEGLHCFYADEARTAARCEPARSAGEPCEATLDGRACADALACLDGRCGPPPTAGAPCGDLGECAAGAICDDRIGTCIATAGEGEACPSGIECRAPSACREGICRAPGGPGDLCGTCAESLDCRFDVVERRFACLGLPAIGEECGSVCDERAYCDVTARACVPAVCEALLPGRY